MTSDVQGQDAIKRRSNSFFRRSRVPFALEDARRQGDISQLAFLLLGGRDAAIAFRRRPHSRYRRGACRPTEAARSR